MATVMTAEQRAVAWGSVSHAVCSHLAARNGDGFDNHALGHRLHAIRGLQAYFGALAVDAKTFHEFLASADCRERFASRFNLPGWPAPSALWSAAGIEANRLVALALGDVDDVPRVQRDGFCHLLAALELMVTYLVTHFGRTDDFDEDVLADQIF